MKTDLTVQYICVMKIIVWTQCVFTNSFGALESMYSCTKKKISVKDHSKYFLTVELLSAWKVLTGLYTKICEMTPNLQLTQICDSRKQPIAKKNQKQMT